MILITGSKSLTGKKIASDLLNEGYSIRCYDDYRNETAPEGCELFNTPSTDPVTLRKACTGIDTVIHILDIRKTGYMKRRRVKQININTVRDLLVIARDTNVKKIIFMSSYEVYGIQKKFPTSEDARLKPQTKFGKDKAKAEKIIQEYIKKDQIDISIIRPALIAGRETTDPMILITLFMALAMEEDNRLYLAGNGDNRFQMTSPEDISSAVSLILKTPSSRGRIYNIGSDNVPTQIEQVIRLKESARLNCTIKHISPFIARLLSLIFKPMKINYLTKEHIQYLTANMMLDSQKAKAELGWAPTKDNIEILNETIDWYKAEKM